VTVENTFTYSFTLVVTPLQYYLRDHPSTASVKTRIIADSWEWRVLNSSFGAGGTTSTTYSGANTGNDYLLISEHIYAIGRYHSSTGTAVSYSASEVRNTTLPGIFADMVWAHDYVIKPITAGNTSWTDTSLDMAWDTANTLTRSSNESVSPNDPTTWLDALFLIAYSDCWGYAGAWDFWGRSAATDINTIARVATQIHSTDSRDIGNDGMSPMYYWTRNTDDNTNSVKFPEGAHRGNGGGTPNANRTSANTTGIRPAMILRFDMHVVPMHTNTVYTASSADRTIGNIVSTDTATRFGAKTDTEHEVVVSYAPVHPVHGASHTFASIFADNGYLSYIDIPADYTGTITALYHPEHDTTDEGVELTLTVNPIAQFVAAAGAGATAANAVFVADSWEWRILNKGFSGNVNDVLVVSEHIYGIGYWNSARSNIAYTNSTVRQTTLPGYYAGLAWAQDYAVLPTVSAVWSGTGNSTADGTTSTGSMAGGATVDTLFLLSYGDYVNTAWGFASGSGNSASKVATAIHSTLGAGISPFGGTATPTIHWLRTKGGGNTPHISNASGGLSTANMDTATYGHRPAMILRIE
jgi:hypothetical protein